MYFVLENFFIINSEEKFFSAEVEFIVFLIHLHWSLKVSLFFHCF